MIERSHKANPLKYHLILWSIVALGFALRVYNISDQPPTDDEVAAAFDAGNYLTHGLFGRVMWYHPPLRNIIIYLSFELFGEFSAWGLRFGSMLTGTLTIAFVGYIGRAIFNKDNVGYCAAFFVAIDPIHITASREAFQEAVTIFFVMAGVLTAFHAMRKDRVAGAYAAGLLFGLAISSKWHGIFPLAVTAVSYLFAPWAMKDTCAEKDLPVRVLTAVVAFVALPLAVYVSVHIPWLYHRGYSIDEFVRLELWLAKHQYYYKGTLYDETMMPGRAWEWFIKPVPWVDFVIHQGKAYVNVAAGNFLVWGLTIPAFIFSVRSWLKHNSFHLGYILVLFVAAYLPLITTSRSVWVFLPPVVQYAFLFNANMLITLTERGVLWKRAVFAYLSAIVLVSAFMYPMSTFRTLEYPWLKPFADRYSPHPSDHPGRK